jgi:hypothetical protein
MKLTVITCSTNELVIINNGEVNMKRKMYIFTVVVFFIIAAFWWDQYKQNKELTHFHQPITINQVEAIHLWVKGTDIIRVPKSEYIKIVEWFNQYDPQKISEEKVPLSNAQVVVDTVEGATIIINYIDGRIYVSRNYGGSNLQYEFLDDAPELENFFEELIN